MLIPLSEESISSVYRILLAVGPRWYDPIYDQGYFSVLKMVRA